MTREPSCTHLETPASVRRRHFYRDGWRIWLLRSSIGLTYLWFGSLKFGLDMSPAEALATTTISVLTHGLLPAALSLRLLAIWECGIGLCFITGRGFRTGLRLMYAHMAGTTTALFLWPDQLFTHIPYQPTLEGQYIIKNLVFIAAAAVLGNAVSERPTVGQQVPDPLAPSAGNNAVAAHHVHTNLGVERDETRDQLLNRRGPKVDGASDAQQPSGRGVAFGHLRQCRIEPGERRPDAGDELFTCRPQARTAGGAVYELYPTRDLEPREPSTHARLGQPELGGGVGDAATTRNGRPALASRRSIVSTTRDLVSASADDVRRTLQIDGHPRRRKLLWVLACTLAVAAVAWGAVGYWRARAERQAPRYRVASVARADLRVTVAATGKLQGINTVQVGTEVTGRVLRVDVDYNDRVLKGQQLAEIDPKQLRSAVAEARAQLLSAESNIKTAEATRVEASLALERARAQMADGLVARKELESAQATAGRAEAGVGSARAGAQLARAALESALSRLAKTKVYSPMDGMVLARLVEPGQTVTAGFQTPILFELAEDLTKLELMVDVDEADVGRVREGMEGSFAVDAYPGREFPTRILALRNNPKTTQNIVTYGAVLSVQNSTRELRPGMTATATIVSETLPAALVVPNAAFRFVPPATDGRSLDGVPGAPATRGRRVYVVRDNTLFPQDLKVGETDGHVTQLLDAALEAGTEVALALEPSR